MDTQTQIERLIELAIVQRTELKELVAQLPQLREHLSTEIEKAFDEAEPQLRAELEEWTTKQAADKTAALGVALEAKIAELSKNLEISTQARYNAIIAEREENTRLAAQAEAKIAEHAASLPSAVKEIVSAELARFPRAGEIDQLRKEFAEPRGLNPRGKWQAGETYNRLDLVTVNGDSFVSNIDGNKERPSRSATNWTLNAARGMGGGSGFTSLNNVLGDPSAGQIVGSEGGQYVRKTLVAGANITINETANAITIIGDEGQISLQDGTAAAPSLFFNNDTDTGIYRPAANTLGISTSGVQRMYVDQNGITTVGAGGTFDGSVHAANGNANNPSFSFSGDQDTGFFRHQPNEIGIALGGTQYATLTSTTFSITPVVTMASSLRVNGTTDSSSKDTGAIVTEGGLGVEKSASIGGNLTVSGTINVGGGVLGTSTGNDEWKILRGASTNYATFTFRDSGSNTEWAIGRRIDSVAGAGNFSFYSSQLGGNALTLFSATGNATLAGNLTVSGTGNSSFAGPLKLTYGTNLTGTDIGLFATSGGGLYINAPTTKNIRFGFNLGDRLTLDENTATFATNLTVSGTGLSSVAGNLNIGEPTGSGYRLYVKAGFGLALGGSYIECGEYDKPCSILNHTNPAVSANLFQIQKQGSGVFTVSSGGNLLIGTAIDGGQKLQVSGTSNFSNPGSSTIANFTNSANADFQIVLTASTSAKIGPSTPTSLILQTNGTTALTLDTSQNATFAGAVTVSGADKVLTVTSSASTPGFTMRQTGGITANRNWGIVINNSANGDFILRRSTTTSGDPTTAVLTFDSTGNATFAGGIIGMTQGNVDNISDDGVASFTPLYNRGFIVINNPDYNQNALIAYFKAGSSYLLYSITKSADVTLNNSTTLTGTTGTDGKLNIGYNNSIIYIENRLGGIANFQRYALGGTN